MTGRAVVEVWTASPQEPETVFAVLTAAEVERVNRLRRPPDRARAATARALLRAVVAQRIGTDPRQVRLDVTCAVCGAAHGKPRVLGGRGVHTSVSYAGNWVLVAVCGDVPVGVDVEQCGALGFAGFDTVALTPAERIALVELPRRRQAAARATAWVRKEAVLKVHGVGLTVSPDAVQVGIDPVTTLVVADPAQRNALLGLADITLDDDYRACVAVAAASPPVVRLLDGRPLLAALAIGSRTASPAADHATALPHSP